MMFREQRFLQGKKPKKTKWARNEIPRRNSKLIDWSFSLGTLINSRGVNPELTFDRKPFLENRETCFSWKFGGFCFVLFCFGWNNKIGDVRNLRHIADLL